MAKVVASLYFKPLWNLKIKLCQDRIFLEILKQTDHGISKIGGLKNEVISLSEKHPTFVLACN